MTHCPFVPKIIREFESARVIYHVFAGGPEVSGWLSFESVSVCDESTHRTHKEPWEMVKLPHALWRSWDPVNNARQKWLQMKRSCCVPLIKGHSKNESMHYCLLKQYASWFTSRWINTWPIWEKWPECVMTVRGSNTCGWLPGSEETTELQILGSTMSRNQRKWHQTRNKHLTFPLLCLYLKHTHTHLLVLPSLRELS